MTTTITMHLQRKPHALDLLEDGDLFYWGAGTKEAWVICDKRDSAGVFIKRQVALEGTSSLLDYTGDDYEVWIDGGSVNIVGLLVWGTSTEHNDQSGEPGGDEIISNDDVDTLTDQIGRSVLIDYEGNYWAQTRAVEGGHLVPVDLFTPRVRAVKPIRSLKLTTGRQFYMTPDGDAWTTKEYVAQLQSSPDVQVALTNLPTTVFVNA